jgi:hypothetical protein
MVEVVATIPKPLSIQEVKDARTLMDHLADVIERDFDEQLFRVTVAAAGSNDASSQEENLLQVSGIGVSMLPRFVSCNPLYSLDLRWVARKSSTAVFFNVR